MSNLSKVELPIPLTRQCEFIALECGAKTEFTEIDIQFRKVKILEKEFLSLEYAKVFFERISERDDDGNVVVNERMLHATPYRVDERMYIHADLKKAFSLLATHVLFINCFVSDDKYNALQEMKYESLEMEYEPIFTEFDQRQATDHDYRMLARVNVIGVSFSGTGGNKSVSIISKIKNQYGKETVNISPLVSLGDTEEKYLFAAQLDKDIDNLESEIIKFMFFGKFGTGNNQLELFNDNQD